MARKRDRSAEDMPSSPVAAKLLGEVTQPAVAVKEATPRVAQSAGGEAKKKEKKRRKTGDQSALAKIHESRVMMSRDERKAMKETVAQLQNVSDTEVAYSHVIRALLTLASRATAAIKANEEHADIPPRPANNDWQKLAAYEDALADYLLIALRDRRHMDTDE